MRSPNHFEIHKDRGSSNERAKIKHALNLANQQDKRRELEYQRHVDLEELIYRIDHASDHVELKHYALELANQVGLVDFQSTPGKPDEWIVTAKDQHNSVALRLIDQINKTKEFLT